MGKLFSISSYAFLVISIFLTESICAQEEEKATRFTMQERMRLNPSSHNRCKIVLSFDDGPLRENTEKLIAWSEEKKVPITLFMLGDKVKIYPDIVRSTLGKKSVMVGHHSQTHENYTKLTNDELTRQELRPLCQYITTPSGAPFTLNGKTIDEIDVANDPFFTGKKSQQAYAYFAQKIKEQNGFMCGRYPGGGGHKTQRIHACNSRQGIFPCVDWTFDIRDWAKGNRNVDYITKAMVNSVVDKCKEGQTEGVFVLHDIRSTTVDAVIGPFLPALEKEFQEGGRLADEDVGVDFVFVDELSAHHPSLRFANDDYREEFIDHQINTLGTENTPAVLHSTMDRPAIERPAPLPPTP